MEIAIPFDLLSSQVEKSFEKTIMKLFTLEQKYVIKF